MTTPDPVTLDAVTRDAVTRDETAATVGPPVRRRPAFWRRHLFALSIGTVLLAVGLLTALLVPSGAAVPLDPANPAPDGGRAAAQILAAHGVRVHPARSVAEAGVATGAAGGQVSVLVTAPDLVDPQRLTALARDANDLVLVQPGSDALAAVLAGDLTVLPGAGAASAGRTAGCDDTDARAAGTTTAGGVLYSLPDPRPTTAVPGVQVCYAQADVPNSGLLVVLTRRSGQRVVVLGMPEVLTNGALAVDGNAALALRLLGHQPDLVWYLPDPLELGGDRPSLSSLLPPWVGWVTVQLLVTALVAMVWRGRRFGPLVREPLPVVVRAAETTEGRARLYRQAGARGWAAATLRTAALRRLARRFEAGPTTTPEQLVGTVSAATGHDGATLAATLLGPAPSNDAALVRLADQIDSLEQDVRS